MPTKKSSTRMPAAGNDKLLEFRVRHGCSVGDNDGVRRDEGEIIMLTRKQGRFMLDNNRVEIDLGDDDDDADTSGATGEGSETEAKGGGATPAGPTSVPKPAPTKK